MNFAVSAADFYRLGMDVAFIDKMAAILSISTDRIKIVGVKDNARRRMLKDGLRFLSGGSSVNSMVD